MVSVESVSFSSCRALPIPPQSWTFSLLLLSLNTRFLRAPAAAWPTPGLGLRSRVTRRGIPPSWKTCNTEARRGRMRRGHSFLRPFPKGRLTSQGAPLLVTLQSTFTLNNTAVSKGLYSIFVLRPPVWHSPLWRWCVGWRWLRTAGTSHRSETDTLQRPSGSALIRLSHCPHWRNTNDIFNVWAPYLTIHIQSVKPIRWAAPKYIRSIDRDVKTRYK